jgi:hypothetical protein
MTETSKATVAVCIEPDPGKEYCEAARRLFMALLASGAVGMRNGSFTVHFDHRGDLRLIDTHRVAWRKE